MYAPMYASKHIDKAPLVAEVVQTLQYYTQT